ncbi:hypothetical protein ES703_53353 [subsurface metagenome]
MTRSQLPALMSRARYWPNQGMTIPKTPAIIPKGMMVVMIGMAMKLA